MVKYRFWILLSCTLAALSAAHVIFVGANMDLITELTQGLDADVALLGDQNNDRPSMALIEERRSQQKDARRSVVAVKSLFSDRDESIVLAWFPETGSDGLGKKPTREAFKRGVQLAKDRLIRELAAVTMKVPKVEELGSSVFVNYPWMSGDELPPKGQLRQIQRTLNVEFAIHRILAAHGARVVTAIEGAFGASEAVSEAMPFERNRFSFVVETAPTNLLPVLHAFDAPAQWATEGGESVALGLNVHVDAITVDRVPVNANNANRFDGEPPVRVEFVLTHFLSAGEGGR